MPREYTGIPSFSIPEPTAPDFTPRLRNMLSTIDIYLRDASFAFGRISRGETPNGGGETLGVTDHGLLTGLADDDHAQYLLLAGRTGGQILLAADSTSVPLTIRGGSNSNISVQQWADQASTTTLDVKVVGGGTPAASLFTDVGTGLNLTAGGSTVGLQINSSGTQHVGGKLGSGSLSSTPALFSVDAANLSAVVADSDDNIRIIRRSATQSGVALRLMEQTRTTTLCSISPEGYFDTPRLRLMDATGDLLSIVPAAATTAHTLTMPAANASGVLTNDGAGALSWAAGGGSLPADAQGLLANDGLGALSWLGSPTAPVGDLYLSGQLALFYNDGTGNGGIFTVEGGTPTASYTYDFPASSGTVVVDATSNLYTLALGTSSILRANTSSAGVSFADNTTTSKRMRFVLSGAVGNNNITVTSTAARTYTLADDSSTLVGRVASSDLTGQTAAFADTTLYTTIHAGLYRIAAYLVFTAVTTPGTITVDATWTDPQATTTDQTFITKAYTAAGDHGSGGLEIYCTAGSVIRWRTTFTGTGTYSLYGKIEAF